jgi:hypothetical protein
MQLPAEEILHKAFRETLGYHGKYAFAQQLLRDAERHLRGDVIAEPGMFSKMFFYSPAHIDLPRVVSPSHAGGDGQKVL